uniref:hypothetical protein n=1 Tax=Arthrobacter sp. H41 TaxID=1312978 RepID=UPI0012DEBE8E|nr:hypothetical protein [Arthrobacter sp. H41]
MHRHSPCTGPKTLDGEGGNTAASYLLDEICAAAKIECSDFNTPEMILKAELDELTTTRIDFAARYQQRDQLRTHELGERERSERINPIRILDRYEDSASARLVQKDLGEPLKQKGRVAERVLIQTIQQKLQSTVRPLGGSGGSTDIFDMESAGYFFESKLGYCRLTDSGFAGKDHPSATRQQLCGRSAHQILAPNYFPPWRRNGHLESAIRKKTRKKPWINEETIFAFLPRSGRLSQDDRLSLERFLNTVHKN